MGRQEQYCIQSCTMFLATVMGLCKLQLISTSTFQLHHERTEERRKLVQEKESGGAKGTGAGLSDRWKKVLGSAMSSSNASKDRRRISKSRPGSVEQLVKRPLNKLIQ